MVGPKPVPGIIDLRKECTLDGMSVHCRHRVDKLSFRSRHLVFLDCGGKTGEPK